MDDNIKFELKEQDGVQIVKNVDKEKAKKGKWAGLGIAGALVAKFFVKLKFLLVFLKLGKLASTFGSMLVMIWIYAKLHGWVFGVGFVLLLFMHEMGHYFAAKRVKLPVSTPIFIPFVGALISMKEEPADASIEAFVAIGGPVLGSISALMCLVIYYVTGKSVFIALAYTGFILNLFNLIPVHPLDGGRVVTAISPMLWIIGIPLMAFAALIHFNPIIIMILVLSVIQLYKYYKDSNKKYYEVERSTRIIYAVTYFGLIAILGACSGYIYHVIPNVAR
ncbi:site-2 protease family protein [Clostridiaceae bacterium UIB06]|uniref:Site-2 protease family protein n=1 Tax=Clostridium thailandense TaxID=2794346 RepID=A0A949WR75_9CLOT|nr:site-2 protease family protein [Clostridium thailandense]MBV7273636.1 site-2 protease family protein [Clostridium thailandense]MCH5137028.1 site-2 protease family protein [Clostridiaceae bacterium UIB06]